MDDNEGEERLNQLISAAREEKLLVTTDEVAKALSVGATVAVTTALVKPVLTIVHKAIIAVLVGSITVASVYYYNYSKKTSSPVTNTSELISTKNELAPVEKTVTKSEEKIESSVTQQPEENNEIKSELVTPEKEKPGKKKERNYFDGNATVVFDFDNKHVEMVATDDVQRLIIDGSDIRSDDFYKYRDVIDYGMALKKEQDKTRAANDDGKAKSNKIIMQALLDELSRLQLISENEGFDFYLKGTKALLNDKELPIENFTALKNVYEKITGKPLPVAANIHIKH